MKILGPRRKLLHETDCGSLALCFYEESEENCLMREIISTMQTVAKDEDLGNSPTIPMKSAEERRDPVNCSVERLFREDGFIVDDNVAPTRVGDTTNKTPEKVPAKIGQPEFGQYSLDFLHEVGNRMSKGAVPRNRTALLDEERDDSEGACSTRKESETFKVPYNQCYKNGTPAFAYTEHRNAPQIVHPYPHSSYSTYQGSPYRPQIKPYTTQPIQEREKGFQFDHYQPFDNIYERKYYSPSFHQNDFYKLGMVNKQPQFAGYGYDAEFRNDGYFEQYGYRTANMNYSIKGSVDPYVQYGFSRHGFYSHETTESEHSSKTRQKEQSSCSSSEKIASGNSSLTMNIEKEGIKRDIEDNSSSGSFSTDITIHSDNIYNGRRSLEQDFKFDRKPNLYQPPTDTPKIFTATFRSRSANSTINRRVDTPPNYQNKRGMLNFRRGFNFYSVPQPDRFGRYSPPTPADKHLTRLRSVEVKAPPIDMLTGSMWDSLSQEIWEKFITHQQTEETFRKKMHLWRDLYIFIKGSYSNIGLYMVGSTISGFGADSSDVDMCLVSRGMSDIDPKSEAVFTLTNIMQVLSTMDRFTNFELIKAKVPILRFSDIVGIIDVDLNYNNCVGVKNTHLLYCYSRCDWRVRPLTLVVKLWARAHDINNAKNRTISSYSLTLMVIHFLQCGVQPKIVPCLHNLYPEKFKIMRSQYDLGYVNTIEHFGTFPTKNKQPLGELMLQFLEYYSNFDFQRYAISVRAGSIVPIGDCQRAQSSQNDPGQWQYLCIEEPFNLTNTARSVYDGETFDHIRNVFCKSWQILSRKKSLDSIFCTKLLLEENSETRKPDA